MFARVHTLGRQSILFYFRIRSSRRYWCRSTCGVVLRWRNLYNLVTGLCFVLGRLSLKRIFCSAWTSLYTYLLFLTYTLILLLNWLLLRLSRTRIHKVTLRMCFVRITTPRADFHWIFVKIFIGGSIIFAHWLAYGVIWLHGMRL
jgi:hypothetical protein